MLRKGFTLIELLLVVIIIGIIASIALPRFSNVREQAYRSVITSDVRTLMTQQELANVQNTAYMDKRTLDNTAITSAGGAPVAVDFRPSANVNIASVANAAAGFSAAARHVQLAGTTGPDARCVHVGALLVADVTAFDGLAGVAARPTTPADGQIVECGAP